MSVTAAPPELPGYSFVRPLGSGGFADVFVYEQRMPRRQVAVKVLHADVVTDAVRRQFDAEANLMAQLSTHPSIVTIHHADIAADGRPYLVMELCPRANLGVRYRQERLAVDEVLRIGVRLASAVETAHRAGILHRDIKPANVLTTDYGWPALTDFGIAATAGQGEADGEGPGADEALGMSVPWAAAELFADPPRFDARSDVYALAATLYTLLARRAPFERPGGPNGTVDLIARAERDAVPPTGRDDVPTALERTLALAMSRDPELRPASALELARALQRVEIELQLPATTIDVADTAAGSEAPGREDVGGDRTRVRGIAAVSPDAPPPTAGPPAQAPAAVADAAPGHRRRRGALVAAVVAAVAVAGVVAAALLLGPRTTDDRPRADETGGPTSDALVETVPAPADLAGAAAPGGGVSFTWTNPDPQPGDTFLWRRADPGTQGDLTPVDAPPVTIGEATGRVCIDVFLRRANGRVSAQPAQACAP